MSTETKTRALALLAVGMLAGSCAAPYAMTPPETFKRFEDSREFKMITADGVMLKARQVDNYPEASLEFWTAAMEEHLEAQGYVVKSNGCFKTKRGLDACTVDFLLPHGAEDWVLSETLFVIGDTVVLVEAAGPFDRFAAIEEALDKSLETFEPNI
jgi:hypothetical protein